MGRGEGEGRGRWKREGYIRGIKVNPRGLSEENAIFILGYYALCSRPFKLFIKPVLAKTIFIQFLVSILSFAFLTFAFLSLTRVRMDKKGPAGKSRVGKRSV